MQIPNHKNLDRRRTPRQIDTKPLVIGLLLLLGTLFIPVCATTSVPVALFVSNVTSGTVPLNVQFIDSSTNTPTLWLWSFGDGSSGTEENPAHTFETAGTYIVTLTVTNDGGSRSTTASDYIIAQSANSFTSVTTALPVEETTVGTILIPPYHAADMAADTTAPAGAASGSSAFTYVIMGIIAIGVISVGAVLYFRSPPRGGHRVSDSQL